VAPVARAVRDVEAEASELATLAVEGDSLRAFLGCELGEQGGISRASRGVSAEGRRPAGGVRGAVRLMLRRVSSADARQLAGARSFSAHPGPSAALSRSPEAVVPERFLGRTLSAVDC
jgi:hypothetical protein